MNRYLLAIVIIAIITWLAMPVPVKVSPPAPVVQVEPPFLPPTFKAKAKRQKAIFCEPLLGCPAYYDDKELMKVGKYGLKYYEWADVIVGDEP